MAAVGPESSLSEERLLAGQRAYYRRRAPEYDEWWQRIGRYDHGEDEARQWVAQVGIVERALDDFDIGADVLELAGGTGWWTQRLAPMATALTVVDASAETLELNRRRVGGAGSVEYVVADLFDWSPGRRYDTVFFSFWLSHVPARRFEAFWRMVRSALRPDGRVFLIDSRRTEWSSPTAGDASEVQRRTLNDGSAHHVVKIFYEPDQLNARLANLGWSARITATPLFIYGSAAPGTS